MSDTYSWQGNSGRWYEFEVVRAQRDWEVVGGIYMFVKPKDPEQPSPLHTVPNWGGPIALFLAKTEDFSQTLARHEMWRAAENLGAKEIHLMIVHDPRNRERFERDILDAQTPILNRSLLRKVA
ncbi:MAG: hypothetical protein QM759_11235 [Terricaulis sp.]